MTKLVTSFGSKSLLFHQETALEWMYERETMTKMGGLLCDEMGLGKTLSMLSLCVNNALPSTLLLCPLAVVQQWVDASKEVGLSVFVIGSSDWVEYKKGSSSSSSSSIFITNIDKVVKRPSMFERTWDRVIVDEAHVIRNPTTATYMRVEKLTRTFTWCLTATPVVNKIQDIAALFHLINSKILHNKKNVVELQKLMSSMALARTSNQLRELLPIFPENPTIVTHDLDFVSDDEKTFYRGIQGQIEEQLTKLLLDADRHISDILSLILRLRQLSIHPQVYIEGRRRTLGNTMYNRPDWSSSSTKVSKLLSLMKQSEEAHETHKWVVFCQFHDEIDIVKNILESSPFIGQIETYHGDMSIEQRTKVINNTKSYNGDKHSVLLIQIHCGGTGLNLQHMDRIVFMSPWWTAALMDQAIGRVVRIGQKNKVVVHHLRLREETTMNIDEMILSKVEFKRELCSLMLSSAVQTI
jgi:SNF2 family DNA or RNA helicase